MLRSLAPYLAYAYMTLVGSTSRLRLIGGEHLEALERRRMNFIYAFWHNRQVLFTYTHRGTKASVLVSRSRDGEIIAETMRLSRIGAIRGSSTRASVAATRELIDAAASGLRLGITPDGPKGPAGQVKPGVLFLALKTGLPILPISNAVSRKIILEKSWDRFQVPLPFSRACVSYGPAMTVSEGDDLQKKALELQDSLNRITQDAERAVR